MIIFRNFFLKERLGVDMAIYDVPKNFKKCRKKLYEIYACVPDDGTIVFNKLEQQSNIRKLESMGLKGLSKKPYLTTYDIKKLEPNAMNALKQAVNQNLCYVFKKGQVLLCGTQGELWTINAEKFLNSYDFVEGMSKERQTALLPPFENTMKWAKVRPKASSIQGGAWACFCPKGKVSGAIATSWGTQLAINDPYSEHGKGDFVMCADAGGRPNLADRWVVNGNIFATTYNNQGWTDCLDSKVVNSTFDTSKLPKLGFGESNINIQGFLKAIIRYVKLQFTNEGFKVEMIDILNGDEVASKMKLRIQETEKARPTTLFFEASAVKKVVSVKAQRDNKTYDKNFDIAYLLKADHAGDEFNKFIFFICAKVYIELCDLFKITPYKFICRPKFINKILMCPNIDYVASLNLKDIKLLRLDLTKKSIKDEASNSIVSVETRILGVNSANSRDDNITFSAPLTVKMTYNKGFKTGFKRILDTATSSNFKLVEAVHELQGFLDSNIKYSVKVGNSVDNVNMYQVMNQPTCVRDIYYSCVLKEQLRRTHENKEQGIKKKIAKYQEIINSCPFDFNAKLSNKRPTKDSIEYQEYGFFLNEAGKVYYGRYKHSGKHDGDMNVSRDYLALDFNDKKVYLGKANMKSEVCSVNDLANIPDDVLQGAIDTAYDELKAAYKS